MPSLQRVPSSRCLWAHLTLGLRQDARAEAQQHDEDGCGRRSRRNPTIGKANRQELQTPMEKTVISSQHPSPAQQVNSLRGIGKEQRRGTEKELIGGC
jgi:hypothetical protein